MEWNEETIARLKALWAEGHSTAEIGRRMGVTKNAVVGKAHRLLLPPRPSPIRREPDGSRLARTPPPRRVTGPTLPSFAAAPVMRVPVTELVVEPPAASSPLAAPRAVTTERRRRVACCWPIGEPGTRSFRFCDDEAVTGKPYCTAHVALAYVKVRDRREEAA